MKIKKVVSIMRVRIGIDVGGTFTDAVAINNDTFELIGYLKIPTTHTGQEGVAGGIVLAIQKIMEKYSISPEEVMFIAHGTTQATNALLEGDVAKVGIVGTGTGGEALKAKMDTVIGNIELAKNKFLYTESEYVDLGKPDHEKLIKDAIRNLLNKGVKVIVASGAFSVDDPSGEMEVVDECLRQNLSATGSHEISKLYGLKIRTRTAAINASILPKMIETANMTESSVHKSGITKPLMIMRCDGGVMDVQEVKKRPVLTMLSGPAAGVAGALMYEKISNGIFLEVGGTSTDISVIRDGQVMIKYAEVGGHKTYVNSLDVHTVGIAGGSMVRIDSKKVVDVGPRSAHIANLAYACFADPDDIMDPEPVFFAPRPGDPDDYAAIKCSNGKEFTITVSCAANYLGYIRPDNYSYGNKESAEKGLKIFADRLGITVEELARQIMDKASKKNEVVLNELIDIYKLEKKYTTLVGGGGGAAAIVPHLAETMGTEGRIAKNAEVISPIGVALAMVRDMVERTVLNPTDEDILSIKREAYNAAINSGAQPDSIEVNVEVDSSRNLVRAIATGTTELRTKDLMSQAKSEQEIKEQVAKQLEISPDQVTTLADTGKLYVMEGKIVTKGFFGLLKKTKSPLHVVDEEGVVRLQKPFGTVTKIRLDRFRKDLEQAIADSTRFTDGGEEVPDLFLIYGKQIRSLSGLISSSQVISLASAELEGLGDHGMDIYALTCSK
ncbi:hydantoinase/oxoprolinase family protein [Lachnospiraceae bacterium 54-53]